VAVERMVYVSPAYERIWGRSTESLRQNPKSFIEAIHDDDRQRVLAVLDSQKDGKPFEHEYRIVRPDGALRWILDRGFPVRNSEGKVTHYVGTAQDVTERKRLARIFHNWPAFSRRGTFFGEKSRRTEQFWRPGHRSGLWSSKKPAPEDTSPVTLEPSPPDLRHSARCRRQVHQTALTPPEQCL